VAGFDSIRGTWNDPIPPTRARRQNAVVPNLMGAGRRYERSDSLEKFGSFHHDTGCPVSPARLEPIGEPTIGHLFEAIE
jgi:hypothetical protein